MNSSETRGDEVRTRPVPSEEAAKLLDAAADAAPLWELDVKDFRDPQVQQRTTPSSATSVEYEEVDAGGVRARLYRPPMAEPGTLVWYHGGAWMLGGLEFVDPLVRALAESSRACVLSVDYRLAPEHIYPAAIDDCWAATRWAAAELGPVAVGGESAGGNLAAAVALRARDSSLALALQVLVVPALDCRPDSADYQDYATRYEDFNGIAGFGEMSRRELGYAWSVYTPDPDRRNEPEACPLRAPSLAGLAPACIVAAEHDILCAEGIEYGRKLSDAGVAVELHEYQGQVHDFPEHLEAGSDGEDAAAKVASAVRRAFGNK